MSRLNPTAVFLVGMVLVLAALFVPGPVGGALLLLLAAFAAVLLRATWDRLAPLGRAARLAVLALLVLLALTRLT